MKSLFQSWGWGVRLVLGTGKESFKGRYDRSIGSRPLTLEGEGTDRKVFKLRREHVEIWGKGKLQADCREQSRWDEPGWQGCRLWQSYESWGRGHPPAVLLSPKGVGRTSTPSSQYYPWAFLQGNCGLPYSPLFSKPGSLQLPLISWAIWPVLGNAPSVGFLEVREGSISNTLEV